MVVHVALYKWKSGVQDEEIYDALIKVRALKDKIPGLQDIRCGENSSRYNEGFTHAIVVLAEDEAALQVYRDHPDHVSVAHDIDAMEDAGIGVDFEDA